MTWAAGGLRQSPDSGSRKALRKNRTWDIHCLLPESSEIVPGRVAPRSTKGLRGEIDFSPAVTSAPALNVTRIRYNAHARERGFISGFVGNSASVRTERPFTSTQG